jgi:hypothetical protein
LSTLQSFVAEHVGLSATVNSPDQIPSVRSPAQPMVSVAAAAAVAAGPVGSRERLASVGSVGSTGGGVPARHALRDMRSAEAVFRAAHGALGEARLAIADFIGVRFDVGPVCVCADVP